MHDDRTRIGRLALTMTLLACGGTTEPALTCETLPVAPSAARIDLAAPVFSDPTAITNPLFPISRLQSVVLLGTVDGLPFRTETTRMPGEKVLAVNGRPVRALESQYVAYLGGRIHEVALDWYAQADDGAVWYLGEDVFNFEDGVVADREGTWQVGREGPAAMIMPASPKIGDVFRPENACPVVFEEVTVKAVGVTVTGPGGPVGGAIIVNELHMDGSREDKTFAPGYGEFHTASGGDVEALAVASDTDVRPGVEPAAIAAMFRDALQIQDAAAADNWSAATTTLTSLQQAWAGYPAGAPPLLVAEMNRTVSRLGGAVAARNAATTRVAAIETARAALDFALMFRPVVAVDRARLDLWATELVADAAGNNTALVRGDVASMEYTWPRIAQAAAPTQRTLVEGILRELRSAADRRDLTAASGAAVRLRTALAATQP